MWTDAHSWDVSTIRSVATNRDITVGIQGRGVKGQGHMGSCM